MDGADREMEERGEEEEEVERQQLGLGLDWMLDSSHVNVGLWHSHDARPIGAREQGSQDLEQRQERSSPLCSMSETFPELVGQRPLQRSGRHWSLDTLPVGLGSWDRLDTLRMDGTLSRTNLAPDANYFDTGTLLIRQAATPWSEASTTSGNNGHLADSNEHSRSIFEESNIKPPTWLLSQQRDNAEDRSRQMQDSGLTTNARSSSFSLPDPRGPFGANPIVIQSQLEPLAWHDSPRPLGGSRRDLRRSLLFEGQLPDLVSSPAKSLAGQQHQGELGLDYRDPPGSPVMADASVLGTFHYTAPSQPRILCRLCSAHPKGFQCEKDLRKHMDQAHPTKRKVWIVVDISADKLFLARCKACSTGKKYGAYYNAAAHLRRVHFNPRKRGQLLKTVKGGSDNPPMDVLRKWMKEVEEVGESRLIPPDVNRQDYASLSALDRVFMNDRDPDFATRDSFSGKERGLDRHSGSIPTHEQSMRPVSSNQAIAQYFAQVIAQDSQERGSTSSIQSLDSGYVSDGWRGVFGKAPKQQLHAWGDVSSQEGKPHCNMSIKDEANYTDADMDSLSGNCNMSIKDEVNYTDADMDSLSGKDNLRTRQPIEGLKEELSGMRKGKGSFEGWQGHDGKDGNSSIKSETYTVGSDPKPSTSARSGIDQFNIRPEHIRKRSWIPEICPASVTGIEDHKSNTYGLAAIPHSGVNYEVAPKYERFKLFFLCPVKECSMRDKIWPREYNFRQHLKYIHKLDPTEELLFKAEREAQALQQREPAHVQGIEKKFAKAMFDEIDDVKASLSSIQAEPQLVHPSNVDVPAQQPHITIEVKIPDHPKERETLPLPFGHPKSRQWTEMLPSIKACTREIMGKGNRGALELFSLNGKPTVCVTCWDPLKLNLALLKFCMEPLGLGISVTQGKIRKSAGDEHEWSGNAPTLDGPQCLVPPVHGHYTQRPTCGASLGAAEGTLKDGKVSLGGWLKIKHRCQRVWTFYAMTVHHVLVTNEHDRSCAGSEGNGEDQAMADDSYDYSPGICNGVHSTGDGPTEKITFSCPAVQDAESLVSRLEGRRTMRHADKSYAVIDHLHDLDAMLNRINTLGNTLFGHAAWSSGLCLDQDVEMDWLLIGDIPTTRIGCNTPGDVAAYMEGNHHQPGSRLCWSPSTHVDESAFNILMNFSTQGWGEPESQGGYLSRIFGRGSETGLADGFLSPHSSIFYDEAYGAYDAWAFTPRIRYGLGDAGDSGTWIFTAEGLLLGQIISYNRERHITYYTPICKTFNHIKKVTGATEVNILLPDDVSPQSKVPYGLPSPD